MIGSARLISLVPSATEILYAIGAGPRVVGVSHECDYPPDVAGLPRLTRSRIHAQADSRAIDQQTRELLQSGQPLYELDAQTIAELRPDWIVTQSQCDVCAVRYDDVLSLVRDQPALANTQVLAVNPLRLSDVIDDVQRIARAIGLEQQGRQAAAELQRRIDGVAAVSRRLPTSTWPRVACVEWFDPLMLAGNWVPGMLQLAGGTCSLTTDGEHSGYLTWSQLRAFDPHVMLLMPCGMNLERTLSEARQLTRHEGWSQLAAVRQGRVFAVDGNAYFNRSGPRLVDSLELLLHLLHPESAQAAGIKAPAYERVNSD